MLFLISYTDYFPCPSIDWMHLYFSSRGIGAHESPYLSHAQLLNTFSAPHDIKSKAFTHQQGIQTFHSACVFHPLPLQTNHQPRSQPRTRFKITQYYAWHSHRDVAASDGGPASILCNLHSFTNGTVTVPSEDMARIRDFFNKARC